MIQKTKNSNDKNLHNKIHIELTEEQINKRLDQIESLDIEDELREFLISAIEALLILDKLVGMKETTIMRLRKIFNKKSEKTPSKAIDPCEGDKPHPRGNNKGKNGQKNYPTAPHIHHAHESLKVGEICPECCKGTLARYDPGIYIRITGSSPLKAVVHETEKFRCNACLAIFEASFEGKNAPKYDEGAHAIIAMLKYGASVPFYRLEKIQKHLHTPMPASTQWDLMENLGNHLFPIWQSLLKKASDGNKFFIDDTKAKVLALLKENKHQTPERKGIFTTGIISDTNDGKIVLYLTGRRHAGENLDRIIKERKSSKQPILMSDALSANDKSDFEFLRSYCLAHGRRKFFDLDKNFTEASEFVIGKIAIAYKNDKYCKENNLTGFARLKYHQEHSQQSMDELKTWCENIIQNKDVEPNSILSTEIMYLLNHWDGLTSFLLIEDAELDNNQLEQKLRLSVLNRKNWLFYKTELGALIGDIICSMIKTCEAANTNPFEYFVWIMKKSSEVKSGPENYLPWMFKAQKVTVG
ncbi:MAG: IS66 family transposase [Parachlamydiales bacterium]|jgi:transposase